MATLNFLVEYGEKYENFKSQQIIDLMTVLYDYLIFCQASSLRFNTFSNEPYKTNHKIYSENYTHYVFMLEKIGYLNARELHKFISYLNFVNGKFVFDGYSFRPIKEQLKICINYDFRGKQMDLF
jgi:hypothetical protein